MKPVALDKIVVSMNAELRVAELPDYPNALNGLQLASATGTVSKVAAAVDACLPVVRQAAERGADLLLVHHGIFWAGLQRLEGAAFEKMRTAVGANIAIYSAHIPLDVHPRLGNAVVLAKALGMTKTRPFFSWKGINLGLRADVSLERDVLVTKVRSVIGGGAVHVCPGGPPRVKKVGIVTGGAGGEVAQAAAEGVDTFITGEGPHWSYTLAEELGVNLIYAGHYATETFGVRKLAGWLERKFGLPHIYIDHPTGL
ncbi:MAG: Nif3-like dinuclear metal center hexameric protein [Verrucomicrobiales bacterium]